MINKIIKKIPIIVRVKKYSFKFKIGRRCSFEKIELIGDDRENIKIGNQVYILRGSELCANYNHPITIGDNTFINQQCLIRPNTTIGKNVSVGQKVSLITDSHEIGPSERRAGKSTFPPIRIEDGCWIGANSTVLGGVKIGKGTIIGAGSLVNRDCEPNSLYTGVPAKLIKRLDSDNK